MTLKPGINPFPFLKVVCFTLIICILLRVFLVSLQVLSPHDAP